MACSGNILYTIPIGAIYPAFSVDIESRFVIPDHDHIHQFPGYYPMLLTKIGMLRSLSLLANNAACGFQKIV